MSTAKVRASVSDLQDVLSQLLAHDRPETYRREEWGSRLTFDAYKSDFDRLFNLGRIFADLPFELLPDQQLNQVNTPFKNALSVLEDIDKLDTSTVSNAQETFNTIGTQIGGHADNVTVAVAPWISYLAYQKGDVTNNIDALTKSVDQAKKILEEAETDISGQKASIGRIVQQAEDIAGDKGVSIFTEQFNNAATENGAEAKTWLTATVVATAITIIAIVAFIITIEVWPVTSWFEWAARAALVGVLITTSMWCGNTYRILRHLQTVNRHKANGLKSFLAFRNAAEGDEATRNAVLLETTKSIFSGFDSGFVKSAGDKGDREVHIVDAGRAISAVSAAGKAASSQ